MENYDLVYKWLADLLVTRTTADWLALFEQADIPSGPMHDLDALIDDPHLAAVGLVQAIEHPDEGEVRLVGPAATWSRTPPSIYAPAPRLGEHAEAVLREAGFDTTEIDRLQQSGALRSPRED